MREMGTAIDCIREYHAGTAANKMIKKIQKRTHGRDTHKRRADTRVEASPQPVAGYALAHDIDSRRIDALLRRLHADFDEVERVADDDGADTAEAAGREGPELRAQGAGRGLDVGLHLVFGLGDVWEMIGNRGGEGRVQFLVRAALGRGWSRHGDGLCPSIYPG